MINVVEKRVRQTCDAIGPRLLERLTLVGGARQALLPLKVAIRATQDVDFIVETRSTLEWQRFVGELETVGFRSSTDEDAPICRYQKASADGLLVVDVMPTTDDIIGFSNRWYPQGHRDRVMVGISSLHATTPLHHLLTKIDAFRSRGASDPVASHDLEDIVAILVSMDELIDDIERTDNVASVEARTFLAEFSRREDAGDLLYAHLDSGAHGLVPGLRARLRALSNRQS
jgi:hypothetical protein